MKLVGVCLLCAFCGASAALRSAAVQPVVRRPPAIATKAAAKTPPAVVQPKKMAPKAVVGDMSSYVPDAPGVGAAKPLPPTQSIKSVSGDSSAAGLAKLGLPDNLASTLAKLASSTEAKKPAGNSTPPAAAGHRAKLDVGFKGFEASLVATLNEGIRGATKDAPWTDAMREQFVKNATDSLSATLKEQLAPLKKSIGKTWMALPQDEQKNELVSTFKSSFQSVYDSSLQTFGSHMKLFLNRVTSYSAQKLSTDALVAKAEKAFSDSLLAEHCYDNSGVKAQLKRNSQAPSKDEKEDKHKFCIQSVMTGVAKRLHDTEDLVSMSARFEAGAMSLTQKEKSDDAAQLKRRHSA